MPSGCSDHRRRFLKQAAVAAKARHSPTASFGCCNGSSAAAFARAHDSIHFHDDDGPHAALAPKPRPAPGVAAGWSGATARLRTLSARELRFEATTGDGAVAVAPLHDMHGKRYAVYRQLQPDAPGQG